MSQEESGETLEENAATSEEKVRLEAYYRWKERNEQEWLDLDDWFDAEGSVGD